MNLFTQKTCSRACLKPKILILPAKEACIRQFYCSFKYFHQNLCTPSVWRLDFLAKILDFFSFPTNILDFFPRTPRFFLDFFPRFWKILPTLPRIIGKNSETSNNFFRKKSQIFIGFLSRSWIFLPRSPKIFLDFSMILKNLANFSRKRQKSKKFLTRRPRLPALGNQRRQKDFFVLIPAFEFFREPFANVFLSFQQWNRTNARPINRSYWYDRLRFR